MTCRSRSGKSELFVSSAKQASNDLPDGVKEMLKKLKLQQSGCQTLIKEVLNFSKILHHGVTLLKNQT